MNEPSNPWQGHWTFFQQFLRHPLQQGSITPSSRFLEQRIVASAGIEDAHVIVELGPGHGGTTRALLRAMGADARLLSIELNPDLYALVRRIRDPRLIAHCGSAQQLPELLALHGLGAPQCVVSGIPFSTLEPDIGRTIVRKVAEALAPGGRFVAYQVSARVAELACPAFGEAEVDMEPFNIPPMRVFRWTKGSGMATPCR